MSPTARAITIACALAVGGSSCARTRVSPQAGVEASVSVDAEAIERGRLLTSTACAGCHATGVTGDSPLAAATPLREIVHRHSLDQLEDAFSEGLVTTHPAMPGYTFRASEIDDIIAYFETLKADQ